MTDEELLAAAREAAANAYAPYSAFPVGAAVLLRDGTVVTGANIENASYPVGICAERAAIARAVAEGAKPGEIEAVATSASPCGACRQWLVEFGVDRAVYVRDGALAAEPVGDLLPDAFRL
jgi:cytidine deaminase